MKKGALTMIYQEGNKWVLFIGFSNGQYYKGYYKSEKEAKNMLESVTTNN